MEHDWLRLALAAPHDREPDLPFMAQRPEAQQQAELQQERPLFLISNAAKGIAPSRARTKSNAQAYFLAAIRSVYHGEETKKASSSAGSETFRPAWEMIP